MKDLLISVRELINHYFNVAVFDGDSICQKILACALSGFAPHSKVAETAALWWDTASAEDLEDGLATLRYWTYDWFPDDGWRWACAVYYDIGLQNFLQQHNFVLYGDVAEEYTALQSAVSWGANVAAGTRAFQAAMRSWDRQARKLGKRRLRKRAEVRIKYRMRHKLYRR